MNELTKVSFPTAETRKLCLFFFFWSTISIRKRQTFCVSFSVEFCFVQGKHVTAAFPLAGHSILFFSDWVDSCLSKQKIEMVPSWNKFVPLLKFFVFFHFFFNLWIPCEKLEENSKNLEDCNVCENKLMKLKTILSPDCNKDLPAGHSRLSRVPDWQTVSLSRPSLNLSLILAHCCLLWTQQLENHPVATGKKRRQKRLGTMFEIRIAGQTDPGPSSHAQNTRQICYQGEDGFCSWNRLNVETPKHMGRWSIVYSLEKATILRRRPPCLPAMVRANLPWSHKGLKSRLQMNKPKPKQLLTLGHCFLQKAAEHAGDSCCRDWFGCTGTYEGGGDVSW